MSSGGGGRPPGSLGGLGDSEGTSGIIQVFRLRDLGTMPFVAVGTRVFVDEDRNIYIGIGNTTMEIAERLGWTQENVWLPSFHERYIEENHPEFPDPLQAVRRVLSQPHSVYDVPEQPTQTQFFATGDSLRVRGLLISRSVRYVDVLVELRQVLGGSYLRVFHLSPKRHPKEGRRRWP